MSDKYSQRQNSGGEDNIERYPNKTFKRGVDWNTNVFVKLEPRKVAKEIDKKIESLNEHILLPDLKVFIRLDP